MLGSDLRDRSLLIEDLFGQQDRVIRDNLLPDIFNRPFIYNRYLISTLDRFVLNQDLNNPIVILASHAYQVELPGNHDFHLGSPKQPLQPDIDLTDVQKILGVEDIDNSIIFSQIVDQVLLQNFRVGVFGGIDEELVARGCRLGVTSVVM